MKAPLSPIAAVALSVLLSVGGSFFWFQRQAEGAIAAAAAHRAEQAEAARPEKPWDFWTPEMEQVAKDLAEEKTRLARRANEVAAREARLVEERKELDNMRRQIESLRAEIDTRFTQMDAQEQRNLKGLVATYSKLSPSATVALFKQMDDAFVAKLLSMMKPDAVSPILEEFSRDPGPEDANLKRVAEITQRMRLLLPPPPAAPVR